MCVWRGLGCKFIEWVYWWVRWVTLRKQGLCVCGGGGSNCWHFGQKSHLTWLDQSDRRKFSANQIAGLGSHDQKIVYKGLKFEKVISCHPTSKMNTTPEAIPSPFQCPDAPKKKVPVRSRTRSQVVREYSIVRRVENLKLESTPVKQLPRGFFTAKMDLGDDLRRAVGRPLHTSTPKKKMRSRSSSPQDIFA